MIGDYLLRLINWLLQGLVEKFPTDFVLLEFSTFQNWLTVFKNTLIPTFNYINNIFPIDILLLLVVLTCIIEITIAGIKVVQYLINLVRGAGA